MEKVFTPGRIALFAIIAFVQLADAAPARIWKDVSGQHAIEAELVDQREDSISLLKPDGTTIDVEIKSLGAADREYLSTLAIKEKESDGDNDRPKTLAEIIPFADKIPESAKNPIVFLVITGVGLLLGLGSYIWLLKREVGVHGAWGICQVACDVLINFVVPGLGLLVMLAFLVTNFRAARAPVFFQFVAGVIILTSILFIPGEWLDAVQKRASG